MGSEKRTFKYVFIPVDVQEPIQERELTYKPGKEVECLLDAAKDHFQATAPKKTDTQLAAQRLELLGKLPQGTKIDDSLLNIATGMQMLENIALLSNSKDYGFIGVNMYLDDEGSVRGSPRNIRASEIARCCGKPLDVRGDAFFGRVLDDGDNFARIDFTLADVSSSAPWVKQAKEQALKRQKAESSAEIMRRMTDKKVENNKKHEEKPVLAKPELVELSPAEAAKDDGNVAFKRGDWEAAVEHYTRAIELEPTMLAALNNRAMALLKMQKWEAALGDCCAVLAKQPSNVKALLRAATAEVELGKNDEAKRHLRGAISAEPGNREARLRLKELNELNAATEEQAAPQAATT